MAHTIATTLAFITFCVHSFVGTRFAIPPLIEARGTIPKATIWLNYLCWHIVTGLLFLFALCLAFVVAGQLPRAVSLICALGFVWIATVSVIATAKADIPFYRFPASYLGASTAVFALLGWVQGA